MPGTIVTNLILALIQPRQNWKIFNMVFLGIQRENITNRNQLKVENKILQYTNNSLKKAQLEGAQHHNHEIMDLSWVAHQQKSLKNIPAQIYSFLNLQKNMKIVRFSSLQYFKNERVM